MFGKLLKYEFKSIGKWYLSLYGAILGLSLILGIWIRSATQRYSTTNGTHISDMPDAEGWLFIIFSFAFMMLIAGLSISTFALIINRFYKNIYSRQGYLTMTLPVNAHQLILSKWVAACIWSLLAGTTIVLSILILVSFGVPEKLPDILLGLQHLWNNIQKIQPFNLFLIITNVFLSSVTTLLMIYLSISIGQLFKDHRILMAFVSYFGIQFILFTAAIISGYTTDYLPNYWGIIQNIILILLSYFGTYHIMTKRLNLQ